MPKPLAVIPTYLRTEDDLRTTLDAVRSIAKTAGESVDLVLVDDGSPEHELVDRLEHEGKLKFKGGGEFGVHRKGENSGFSRTVNVGLRRALNEGRDAVLLNADVEIITPGWPKIMRRQQEPRNRPAALIGALLIYPNGGLIQHAGIYFSLITRDFNELFKYAPPTLKEACEDRVCPVTGAFQYIRHSTLEKVGLYDEEFRMGWEDVDYCIRVMLADECCIFTSKVRAWHHEYMFRGRPSPKVQEWQQKSWFYFVNKYAGQSFGALVPFWDD